MDYFNGQKLWKSHSAVRIVHSDASSTNFAGYITEHGTYVAHGLWIVMILAVDAFI